MEIFRQLLIGSRGSRLALAQTRLVAAQIEAANPGLRTEIRVIKTQGDLVQDKPLQEFGTKGVFVQEIEQALLSGEIDLAVHSLKDMPAEQPEGLEMAITPRREDPRDVIITFGGQPYRQLADMPAGSVIATGSLRRICQLQRLNAGLQTEPIRGNVETRLRKSEEQGWQGVVLAAAGLNRLGMGDLIARQGLLLEPEQMLPAPAQGILGLETRVGDKRTLELLQPLHHLPSHRQAQAERAFLRCIEGGCHAPMGAFCRLLGDKFEIEGFFQTERQFYRQSLCGEVGQEAAYGQRLAEIIKEMIAHEC